MAAKKISMISAIHYAKLVFRSLMLLWAVFVYFWKEPLRSVSFAEAEPRFRALLVFVWCVFAVEMAMRFFPTVWESMGSQKQFARNFIDTGLARSKERLDTARQTLAIVLAWVALNGAVGLLYFKNIIDDGILFLISLFYSVADMICILFFCPFQTWFMKNRCCATCRIYNWDYLMMFTPLAFIRSLYTWSLVGMAAVLLTRWELAVHRHPERFVPACNANLQCANCKEKLCFHKKQLHRLWNAQREKLERQREKLERLYKR